MFQRLLCDSILLWALNKWNYKDIPPQKSSNISENNGALNNEIHNIAVLKIKH